MMSIWSATPLAHLTYDPSELKFGPFCLFVILAFPVLVLVLIGLVPGHCLLVAFVAM